MGRKISIFKGWLLEYCKWTCLLFLLIVGLTLAGCQPSGKNESDVEINWEIDPDPPTVGVSTINITLRDSTNQLITGADVELEGNMSHPGMQPVFAEAEETEPGSYSTTFEFTMGGDWFILVESTLPDQSVVEHQINISGVQSQ